MPAPPPRRSDFLLSNSLAATSARRLGDLSRIISLAIAIDMIVAYVLADRMALFAFFSDPGKFYNADPYTFLFAALLILIFGPGKLSLDTLVERLIEKPKFGEAQRSTI